MPQPPQDAADPPRSAYRIGPSYGPQPPLPGRDGRTIGDYELESLRHEKDDVKEVPRGMECGIKLAGFNDIKQDDVLEAYKIEEVARTL